MAQEPKQRAHCKNAEAIEWVRLTCRKGSTNPLRSELRRWRVGGGFTPEVFDELKRRPEAVRELACEIGVRRRSSSIG